MGVVHRDVKPANLLLDAGGHLWVTDFGLARLGDGAGLTVSGDLLGTLRYMSPEQALAKHGLVDHRTDVYALGATLYELLTLRPAVGGEDKQEVLRRIAFEEPTPPRKLDKAIPAELETITLKALAKDPAERYATAGELADDLWRFLTDEPIRARRPTPRQRLARWARRHTGATWAAVTALFVVAVAAPVSTALIYREQLQTRAALAAEARRRQEATDALEAMTSDYLGKQETLLPEHAALLKKALSLYEDLAADTGQDETARAGVAAAHLRVGKIRARLGLNAGAEEAFARARQLYAQLAADFPALPAYREGLAASHHEYGYLLHSGRRLDEAEAAYRAAIALRRQLAAEQSAVPGLRWDLSFSHSSLGDLLKDTDRVKEAEQAYRAALDLRDRLAAEFPSDPAYRRTLAGSRVDLASLLGEQADRRTEAEAMMRDAIAVYRQVAQESPTVENRFKLAWAYGRQALLLGRIGRPEAEAAYRGTIAVHEQLVAEFPSVVKYRGGLSRQHNNFGVFLKRQRRWTEAVMQFREAIRLDRDSALPHQNLGEIFYSQGRLDEAIGEWREVIRIGTDLAKAHFHLGAALAKKGQLDEAAAEYRQAVGIKNDFAEAHYCLGLVLLDMGRPADALASLKRGHELGSRTPAGSSLPPSWSGSVSASSKSIPSSRRS
jgi:tetratricopeptide (TPR) repeat protein